MPPSAAVQVVGAKIASQFSHLVLQKHKLQKKYIGGTTWLQDF